MATQLKHLKIDEKWGVFYDPDNNDRPLRWTRYDEIVGPFEEDNAVTAMFYALLEKHNAGAA